MNTKRNPENEPVAAVCGNEVRMYGPVEKNGIRPFLQMRTFPHYGAARLFAQEYEEPVVQKPAA